MHSNIDLFKQTIELFERDSDSRSDDDSVSCDHPMVETFDSGEKLCSVCGEVLQHGNFIVENIGTMKQRRRRECTIFNGIPCFLAERTRDVAIDIYRLVTKNTSNRTMRKAILLACVHRASVICEESVSFDDLVEMSGIKAYKACRGINYVSESLSKSSEYSTPFFQSDAMIVKSLMRNIGLEDQAPHVAQIVKIVNRTSSIFNVSHYKSVVCGCIYFWLSTNERNISMSRFAQEVNVSHMTIKKKHFDIKTVMLRNLLRKIFSNLLTRCLPKYTGRVHSNAPGSLYEPHLKLYVENYADAHNIRVRNHDSMYLPIEDVTDIRQWNILLDTKYYDDIGNELQLDIELVVHARDVTFNCTKYDDRNRENGKNIIANTIIEEIAMCR